MTYQDRKLTGQLKLCSATWHKMSAKSSSNDS